MAMNSTRARPVGVILVSASIVCFVVACSSASPTNAPAPTSASKPAAAAKPATGGAQAVDMNALFPPGPGRELVLNNCTNCHSIAPIVLSQFDEGGWRTHRLQHSPRVPGLSEGEKDQLWNYLIATFPPGRQIPQLPPELLQGETGY